MAGAEKQVFRVFNHLAAVPAVFADPLQGGGRVRLIFLADREQADVNPVLLHFVNDLAAPTFVEQQIDVGVPVLQAGINPAERKLHMVVVLCMCTSRGTSSRGVDSCQPFTI